MLKLHVFPGSPRAQKVLAVAHQLDLPFEQILVDLSKGEHKTPEFLKLNPNGRMPVLQDGDFVLWESDAIIQYLAAKKPGALMPTDVQGRALMAQWLSWNMADWDKCIAVLMFEYIVKGFFRKLPPDPERAQEGAEKLTTAAKVLDQHLAKHVYVLGDKLSVVDFALGMPLRFAPMWNFSLTPFPAIERWLALVQATQGWKKSAPAPRPVP